MEELDLKAGFPPPGDLQAALEALPAVRQEGRFWHPAAFGKLKSGAEEAMEEHARRNPWSGSIPLKQAFAAVGDRFGEDLLARIAQAMGMAVNAGAISIRKDEALPPELRKVLDHYSRFGLQPPKPEEAAAALGVPLPTLRKQVEELIKRGIMVRVSTDFHVVGKDLDAAVEKLRKTGWAKFSIGEFKDLLGLTRRHAVPLLEYLDGRKITIRAGDARILKK
jgi:selenocysteine-specific elongation factor